MRIDHEFKAGYLILTVFDSPFLEGYFLSVSLRWSRKSGVKTVSSVLGLVDDL